MHCHTFFSFNAYGHSPASLAWLGRKHGFKLMGIVDFDVLDGIDEFLEACEVVDLRCSAGIETRVFIPEYASQEINSPGEPGVCYHMGIGFTSSRVPQAVAGRGGRAAGGGSTGGGHRGTRSGLGRSGSSHRVMDSHGLSPDLRPAGSNCHCGCRARRLRVW